MRKNLEELLARRALYLLNSISFILVTAVSFWVFLTVDFWLLEQVAARLGETAQRNPILGDIIDGVRMISGFAIAVYYVIHVLTILWSEAREIYRGS